MLRFESDPLFRMQLGRLLKCGCVQTQFAKRTCLAQARRAQLLRDHSRECSARHANSVSASSCQRLRRPEISASLGVQLDNSQPVRMTRGKLALKTKLSPATPRKTKSSWSTRLMRASNLVHAQRVNLYSKLDCPHRVVRCKC